MNFNKKIVSAAITGILTLSLFGSNVSALSGVTFRENTAKFQIEAKRQVWNGNLASEGHRMEFKLTNIDTVNLTNWALEFDYNGDLNVGSDGNTTIVKTGEHHYMVTPKSWNKILAKNGKIDFGYTGKSTHQDLDLNNVTLYSVEKPLKTTVISEWTLNQSYKVDDIVVSGNKFYSCIQAHTAYDQMWKPSIYTQALWKKTTIKHQADVNVLIKGK